MEDDKMKKKIFAVTLSAALAASVAGGTVMPAAAATRTVSTKATAFRKAPAVKTGKNKVKIRKSASYVKFKAKKTKTYTFTFSNVNALRKADRARNSVNGFVYLGRDTGYSTPMPQKVATNYGKISNLQLASANFYKTWKRYQKKKKPENYLTKRYAKIKLKKGQTVYIYHFFAGVKDSQASYKLTIK
jgi:hypothetical protein